MRWRTACWESNNERRQSFAEPFADAGVFVFRKVIRYGANENELWPTILHQVRASWMISMRSVTIISAIFVVRSSLSKTIPPILPGIQPSILSSEVSIHSRASSAWPVCKSLNALLIRQKIIFGLSRANRSFSAPTEWIHFWMPPPRSNNSFPTTAKANLPPTPLPPSFQHGLLPLPGPPSESAGLALGPLPTI